jgi:hypothetical protein
MAATLKSNGGGQTPPPSFDGKPVAKQFAALKSDPWYVTIKDEIEVLELRAETGLLNPFVSRYFTTVFDIADGQPTLARRELVELVRKLPGGAAAMTKRVEGADLLDWTLEHLDSDTEVEAARKWAASAADRFAKFFRDSQVFRQFKLPDYPAMFFELLNRLREAHEAKARGEAHECPEVSAALLGFSNAYLESHVVLSIPTNDGHIAMSWPMSKDDFPKHLTLDQARLFLLTRHQIDVADTTLKARAKTRTLKTQGKFDRDLLDAAAKAGEFEHGNKRKK